MRVWIALKGTQRCKFTPYQNRCFRCVLSNSKLKKNSVLNVKRIISKKINVSFIDHFFLGEYSSVQFSFSLSSFWFGLDFSFNGILTFAGYLMLKPHCRRTVVNGPPHMADQKQEDQLEHTYNSSERIQDVSLKTWQKRWTIGRSGKRESGISVLVAWHDDDDTV